LSQSQPAKIEAGKAAKAMAVLYSPESKTVVLRLNHVGGQGATRAFGSGEKNSVKNKDGQIAKRASPRQTEIVKA